MKLLIFVVFMLTFSLTSSFAQEEYRGTQKFLKGVGAEYDPQNKGFDIEYVLEGQLHNFILLDYESNSVTFEYDSKGIEEDVLIIYLPQKLIEEPIGVFINGSQEPNAIRTIIGDETRMVIPLFEDSKTITIKGVSVMSKGLPPNSYNFTENVKTQNSENSLKDKNSQGGGCLIATASFGSELSPQVQQLREIRDNKILKTETGTKFMNTFNNFYYSFSPIIADYERQNPIFKEAVKYAITPMVSSLSILNFVEVDSEVDVLGYGLSLILLNVGIYFVLPATIIKKLKNQL